MEKHPVIDAQIAKAAPFAQPILTHIRALMHAHLPEGEEAKKWSAGAFTYKGTIVAMMAGFKGHVIFGFWYGKAVTGSTGQENAAMGSFGRITSLADLPADAEIARMIRASVDLIDAGVKPPQFATRKPPKPEAPLLPALAEGLAGNTAASKVWAGFTNAQRREYCEWVAEAKRDETRDKRVAEAVGWIAEGKTRNWKYQNC
jgi:uncharacterized protein YdeI (YjbR/CyaY-like superfamily)